MKRIIQFFIAVLIFFGVPLSTLASDSWPLSQGTPQQTNYKKVTLSNELFLKHEMDLQSIGNPRKMLVNDQILYTLDSDGKKMSAFSLETKAVKWEFAPPNGNIILDFVIFNGNIAVATTDRTYLVKDEGFNKSIVWEKDVGGNNLNFDDLSIFVANNNVIHSLNGQTGELKWSNTMPAATVIQGTISISFDKVYAITEPRLETGRKLFALSKATGGIVWTSSFPDFAMIPLVLGDKIFISGQPMLLAFNASNGAYAWRKTPEKGFTGLYRYDISASEDTVFGRTGAGMLMGYTMAGDVKFNVRFAVKDPVGTTGSFSRGPLLVTSNQLILEYQGNLEFYDTATGNHEHTITIPNVKLEPVLVTEHYLIARSSSKLHIFAPPADSQYVDPDGNVQPEQPNAPDPVPPQQMIYVVKSGDTLWKIANQFGTTVQNIAELNKLDPNVYLWVGQNLTVPKPQKTHIVQAGDTLWKISNQYGITITMVMEANKLPSSEIWVGQRLIIPELAATVKTHTVIAGDTLWKIANQYGTTIQAIVDKNNLPNTNIWVGQKLLIP
ncbi:LysM repeat protein/outer membrane protein assembly factor BamB [Bacillus sp. SLBN-46]|uniref:LysM peptidoglycan-binding domain-containing protein n=1 Tax=Bacillus sp. SLBN-46 TaxID=3042283 RepID=UPI0028588ABD|nr:LysM peptidoglycan-binding domain-containing protein [Bacillus sp. SLBN-46]MDR6123657.1 LysM repeat protein/outer membrane protein assembly factor BamB [Bacillus sp. SLBN-46]